MYLRPPKYSRHNALALAEASLNNGAMNDIATRYPANFAETLRAMHDDGLPLQALVDAMRVERLDVHAWLHGSEPSADAQARMEVVHQILRDRGRSEPENIP